MTAGIKFEFTHRSDLSLAEAIIDDVSRARFASGDIKVIVGDKIIGTAGKLTPEEIKSIPQGATISLVSDFNLNERIEIGRQVAAVNASGKPPVLSIVR